MLDRERRTRHLVETDWLKTQLESDQNTLRLVDMRGYVRVHTSPEGVQTATYLGAREEYDAGHLPGAIYLDWTRDIVDEADPVPAQVASGEKLSRVLGSAGIGSDSQIVIYDNHPASQFATRLWWVLRYYGHTGARVLNGGWSKWTREGGATTIETPIYRPALFVPNLQPSLRATAEEVLRFLQQPDVILVDARDEGQYSGRIRRGKRAGHIPGAKHLPREAFFAEDGTFRTPEELRQIVLESGVDPVQQVVAYCNGGVAATSVLFTLSMLGFPRLMNYDGSWNEWAERADLPLATV